MHIYISNIQLITVILFFLRKREFYSNQTEHYHPGDRLSKSSENCSTHYKSKIQLYIFSRQRIIHQNDTLMLYIKFTKDTYNPGCCLVVKSCPALCDTMDCSLPGSSVHEIFQARILVWVAISFSRGSSLPSDQTHVSGLADIFFFTTEPPGKPYNPGKQVQSK